MFRRKVFLFLKKWVPKAARAYVRYELNKARRR